MEVYTSIWGLLTVFFARDAAVWGVFCDLSSLVHGGRTADVAQHVEPLRKMYSYKLNFKTPPTKTLVVDNILSQNGKLNYLIVNDSKLHERL